ncbi:MAG TPA: spore protease YyaC [Bacillota bacterium]|nr:spore protease YyaC [Bacillota bacterium]
MSRLRHSFPTSLGTIEAGIDEDGVVLLKDLHFSAYDEKGQAELLSTLNILLNRGKEVVVVCVGTDRSAGDSLGPLVGTLIKELIPSSCIYGTLSDPVHATNLAEKMNYINSKHPGAFILAIDACLGNLDRVGHIVFKNQPLIPGAGVKKELQPVGDACITGIVNVGGFLEFFALQNTRLWTTYSLAKIISGIVGQVLIRKATIESIAIGQSY